MSEKTLSGAVLETSLRRANGLTKDAGKVYQLARNLVFTVGLTVSIFLPLASSDMQPPDSTQPTITLSPNIQVQPAEPVVEVYPSNTGTAGAPSVDVRVVTSAILGAPPMGRDWHRTIFQKQGDQFWALPDANFIMEFTPTGNFGACRGDICTGEFVVTDREGGQLLELETDRFRTITVLSNSENADCSETPTPLVLTQTLMCQLTTSIQTSCVEFRRSEHPQVTNTGGARQLQNGALALDIRWSSLGRRKTCND